MCDLRKEQERKHLQALLERIQRTDGDRTTELDQALIGIGGVFAGGLAGVVGNGVGSLDDEASLIYPKVRPAILVNNNAPTPNLSDPDPLQWGTRLSAAMPALEPVVKGVGRIEMLNHFDSQYAGTGFMVGEGIVATAFHVAHAFARKVNGKPTFRRNLGNQVIEVHIDFMEESGSAEDETFRVLEVLYMEQSTEIALLRVEAVELTPANTESAVLPGTLALSEDDVTVAQEVVTIGYPGKDATIPDKATVNKMFGPNFEKKRLAPGRISAVTAAQLTHDCSTLSGNSGSPVVDLETGRVVGLHVAGQYNVGNFAVPAVRIADALKAI